MYEFSIGAMLVNDQRYALRTLDSTIILPRWPTFAWFVVLPTRLWRSFDDPGKQVMLSNIEGIDRPLVNKASAYTVVQDLIEML